MHLTIDFRSNQPIYAQIVDQIQHMIATGSLKPGDQLPTVRQLAADLRVNFNTIARAYRILDESGLISTQQGRGTYIWDQPSEAHTQRLRKQGLDELTHSYLEQARHLGYQASEIEEAFQKKMDVWRNETSLD